MGLYGFPDLAARGLKSNRIYLCAVSRNVHLLPADLGLQSQYRIQGSSDITHRKLRLLHFCRHGICQGGYLRFPLGDGVFSNEHCQQLAAADILRKRIISDSVIIAIHKAIRGNRSKIPIQI